MSTDAVTEDDDYMSTDDEYGYLSGNSATDYDDDELESMIHFNLLKVPPADYKHLSPEESDFMFKPIKGEEFKQESKVEEESKEEQVSKEEESKVVEKEEDDDIEESKVPKTNDDDGASGPRGTSWKSSRRQ